MQSTVKKYKADLATAENTVTNLNHEVCSSYAITIISINILSNMYWNFRAK